MRIPFSRAAARALALMPPDPGLLRMVAALRATSAGLLTFLLVAALGLVLPLTEFDRILGFAVALFASATVRDPKRRQQAATILLAGLCASLTVTAAALLSSHRIVTELLVPMIMFAATYGSARAPRWSAVGTVALIAYIVALVTHQSPGSLAGGLLTVWLGAADAALIRFCADPGPANPPTCAGYGDRSGAGLPAACWASSPRWCAPAAGGH